jgi:DNA adenine methylase
MARIQTLSSLTPFRYPGSKNKLLSDLVPHLNNYLEETRNGKQSFSDAFVGGGSVLLAVASLYPNTPLYANDKDYWMYCFWKVVSDTDRTQLDAMLELVKVQPTIELFRKLRGEAPITEVDCAYRAIFFNRTTFSGIARSGPIGGDKQESKWTVDCRYNTTKLVNKIEKCHQLLSGRTQVDNKDITEYSYLTGCNQPIYLDPPYYVKGDMLYQAKMDDFHHSKMADILSKRSNWVLSYDDCPEIRNLYKDNQIIDVSARYCIDGKKTDWKGKNELIILP